MIIVVLISIFLFITYSFSFYDKVSAMDQSFVFYKEHFKDTWILKILKPSLWLISFLEFSICLLLVYGSYSFLQDENHELLKTAFISSSCLLLLFLVGQRIAKDYPGATSLGVYFLINVLGIYLL